MGFIFSKFSKLGRGLCPTPQIPSPQWMRQTNFSNPPTPFGLATPLHSIGDGHLITSAIHIWNDCSVAGKIQFVKSSFTHRLRQEFWKLIVLSKRFSIHFYFIFGKIIALKIFHNSMILFSVSSVVDVELLSWEAL